MESRLRRDPGNRSCLASRYRVDSLLGWRTSERALETFLGAHFGLRWQSQRDAALLAAFGSAIRSSAIHRSYPGTPNRSALLAAELSKESGVARCFPTHSKNAAVVGLG